MVTPRFIVEQSLDRIEEITSGFSAASEAHQAYDLLAHHAKLLRVRPELLVELNAQQEVQAAEAVMREKGRHLAELAMTVPNATAWMRQAAEIGRAHV